MKTIGVITAIVAVIITLVVMAQDANNLDVKQNIEIIHIWGEVEGIRKNITLQQKKISIMSDDTLIIMNNQKHIIKQLDNILFNQIKGTPL